VFQWNDLSRQLRSQAFASHEEMHAFLASLGSLTPSHVTKILGAVQELQPRSTPEAHEARCALLVQATKRAPSPELFVPFLRAVKVADAALRGALLSVIPLVNNVAAHAELVELLGSGDATTRGAAVELVKQIGGPSALELATKRVAEPAFAGRVEAIAAFAGRAAAHALPLLEAVLTHGRAQEKIVALRTLGDWTKFARDLEGAVRVATHGLADRDDLVVAQAINALGLLEDPEFWQHVEPAIEGRGIEVVRAFLQYGAKQPGDAASALFRDRFRQGPKAIRLAIIESVEGAANEALYPTLIEALSHKDVAIRTRAAHAVAHLSQAGHIDAARAIVWLLRSSQVNVRRLAAEIANRVKDEDGALAPKLLQFLRDEDWWVRERVLDALVELDSVAITKQIVKDYLGDPSGVVRRFAVAALMRIGDRRALGALVRTAQADEDWFVAELAVEAIGKLGDERATAYLVDLLRRRPEIRVACIGALRALRATESVPDVAELAQDHDSDVRAAALNLLEELDDGSHALWAKGAEDDPSPTVREAAGRVLRRFRVSRSPSDAPAPLRTLDALLSHAVREQADDLFLLAGQTPFVKVKGRMSALGRTVLNDEQIRELVLPQFSPAHAEQFEQGREVDFSYELSSRALRFRVNVFRQITGIGAVFRTVKNDIRSLGDLQIPPVMQSFAEFPHGLVLVGGPTGAGKSTTLAALVDHINRHQARHIITIEDPIEVVHRHQKSLITQREVGAHTHSFRGALKSALRQDPDVILVGELRDLDTISFAVTAAETGHLVFGTVHTTSADATVDRLIHAFPAKQQPQVRGMLAESLRAVTCQHLVLTKDGKRRPVVEVMIANDAVQALIRKGKTFQIPTVIGTSRDQGMQLMDTELTRLAKDGEILVEEAHARVVDKRSFELALGLPPTSEPLDPSKVEAEVARRVG
jgi:twitching motility protein PilT